MLQSVTTAPATIAAFEPEVVAVTGVADVVDPEEPVALPDVESVELEEPAVVLPLVLSIVAPLAFVTR